MVVSSWDNMCNAIGDGNGDYYFLIFFMLGFIAALFINGLIRMLISERDINCNKCFKTISIKYKYCPHCGEEQK